MRKLFIILFFLFAVSAEAAAPSRQNTYVSGTVIESADVTANEDAIFNYLQAGVDTYADGTIVNADINSSANIQSDKLNLTAIAQSVANSGSTTLTGTFAANGTTNSIGNGGSDTLTLNVPGGMTLSAATTWTLTGALTFSGTIADLGTVTTANIDGGTLDGVQIGGTTATGELIVNDSSDDADGLGSQGTSGQFLQSAGAGANPTWGNVFRLISATSMSSVATSADVSITRTKQYKVIVDYTHGSAGVVSIGFNSSSAAAYDWRYDGSATSSGAGSTGLTIAPSTGVNTYDTFTFEIRPQTNSTGYIGVSGSFTGGNGTVLVNFLGTFNGENVTDFEIRISAGTMTGTIYLYEYPQS